MRVVYIAGKFRGANDWERTKNCDRARDLSFAVAELGAFPWCPHSNTRHFDGTLTDEFWLAGAIESMYRCDAVITVDNWGASQGAIEEVRLARERDMPVFHSLWELQQWLDRVGR